jgi:hypothetical protein
MQFALLTILIAAAVRIAVRGAQARRPHRQTGSGTRLPGSRGAPGPDDGYRMTESQPQNDTALLLWVIAALLATFLVTWSFFHRMYA